MLILVSLLTIDHFDNAMHLLHWGVPSVLIGAACIAMEPCFKGNRLLMRMGDFSYSVYLLHVIILSLGWYLQARLDARHRCLHRADSVAAWGSDRTTFLRARQGLDRGAFKAASAIAVILSKLVGLYSRRHLAYTPLHDREELP